MILLFQKKNPKKQKQKQILNNMGVLNNLNYKIYNQPYNFFKPNYNSIIPLKIFQTWKTKDLPAKMRERVESLKSRHPRFEHYLYNDNDCREFIQSHFRSEVLEAYDKLIPGAYKADLWRLCVLFIHGGIYLDIKLNCTNGFHLIELTETEHYVIDRPPNSIYNGLLCCRQGNPFLFMAIHKIVQNVKNRYYGNTPLYPTGPNMLGKLILNKNIKLNTDMIHYDGGGYLIYKNRFVLSTDYPEYNSEKNDNHYSVLWEKKQIYH
jgi:mannosyltransferase OCH1-like enzyme